MSSSGEAINDQHKAYKLLYSPSNALSRQLKATLTICMVTTTALFFYMTISNHSEWLSCPHCNKIFPFQYSNHTLKYTTKASVSIKREEKTNVSHILFGVAGSAKSWDKRYQYTELWWRPNITRGYVWLDKKARKYKKWSKSLPPYKVSADTKRFTYTYKNGFRSAIRIARIVKESFELGLDNVRWFVLGDDDTVFFIENLVTVLGKYDHKQMYYIGSISENVLQNMVHGYTTAYGGGGFAISYALAAKLVRILDGCIDRYADAYGSDSKIASCVSEIGVSLTKELGFHQLDIRGSPYGILAAHPMAPLVSLHHLDYLSPLFPGYTQWGALKKLKGVYDLDPGRILQQSFCYDLKRNWTISVSWGYSIQLYPSIVRVKELQTVLQTFLTWATYQNGPWTFNTENYFRDPCVLSNPIVYFLDRVKKVGSRRTLTTYKKFDEFSDPGCRNFDYASALAVRHFHVSASTFNPEWWKKTPRRKCCEVIRSKKATNNTVQVKIRSCKPFESVSPP